MKATRKIASYSPIKAEQTLENRSNARKCLTPRSNQPFPQPQIEISVAGFVYVMTNPSHREGLVKIGKSDRDPSIRADELFTTGSPDKFSIQYYAFVQDHHALEREVHQHLAAARHSERREFFNCGIPAAIHTIRSLARDTLKFEEVFYKNEQELANQLNKERAAKEERESQERQRSKLRQAESMLADQPLLLKKIIADAFQLHESIQRSKSLSHKLLSVFDSDVYAPLLKVEIERALQERETYYQRKSTPSAVGIEALENSLASERRALTHLLRKLLGRYYAEASEDYSWKFWSAVNKRGAMDGPCYLQFADRSESGILVDGKRSGEFVVEWTSGKIELIEFLDNQPTRRKPILSTELLFHPDQGSLDYSVLLKKK